MQKQTVFSKDFNLVILGQIISIFGNQILGLALPLYLLNQTGSAALFGTVMAFSFIPMILLFPIGGIVADRVNKKNIMVILDFATAGLVLLFYLLVGLTDIVPLTAITMIVLVGIKGAYQPAVQASIPALVAKEHLMRANSTVNLVNSLASMLGPLLGGILFSLVGLTPILYVSIGCFIAAAVMETFIKIPFERKPRSCGILVAGWSDLKESFGFMFKARPVLWKSSVVYASVNLLLTSLVLIGLPVIITQHLGLDADVANRLYGYSQTIVAVGAILGGVLASVMAKRLKPKIGPLILLGCAVSVLVGGIALRVLVDPMTVFIVLAAGSGSLVALSTIFQIQIMSFVQILTPKDLIGKIIACVICVCMCTNPVGQFAYGVIFEGIGSATFIPFYAAALAMMVISAFSPRIFSSIDRLLTDQE